MADAFQERERGFERKFAFDQELAFKVKAHRDRLFGLWVAAQLAKSGTDAERYAREVAMKNFEHPGDADMLDKVRGDLKAQKVRVTDPDLLRRLRNAELRSRRDILGPEN